MLDLIVYCFFGAWEKKYRYVVICPSDGTCNHLTYFDPCYNPWTIVSQSLQSVVHGTTRLIWPELTHSTIFHSEDQLRHGSLGIIRSNVSTISDGSLVIPWFFLKISQMVICPVRGTYNHVTIFFCLRTKKKAFKLPSRATFAISKFPYLFRVSNLSGNFNLFREFVGGDMYNQRYMSPRG